METLPHPLLDDAAAPDAHLEELLNACFAIDATQAPDIRLWKILLHKRREFEQGFLQTGDLSPEERAVLSDSNGLEQIVNDCIHHSERMTSLQAGLYVREEVQRIVLNSTKK